MRFSGPAARKPRPAATIPAVDLPVESLPEQGRADTEY